MVLALAFLVLYQITHISPLEIMTVNNEPSVDLYQ